MVLCSLEVTIRVIEREAKKKAGHGLRMAFDHDPGGERGEYCSRGSYLSSFD